MKHNILFLLFLCTFGYAETRLLDFWDEELRLFGTANKSQRIDADLAARRSSGFDAQGFTLDHANAVVGDLSVLYTPAEVDMPERFGFVAGLWDEVWALTTDFQMKLAVETLDTPAGDWTIRFFDTNGNAAEGILRDVGGDWKTYRFPLSTAEASAAFNWGAVQRCEIEAVFSTGALIYLDGIRFENGKTVIGVTDKALEQRMAEAEANLAKRVAHGQREAASKYMDEAGSGQKLTAAFNKMMLNEDLEWANAVLREALLASKDASLWSLYLNPAYCRFYYWFSNSNGTHPGRMTPENEKRLLETLWERTKTKNDIHWARQSDWYLDGSENHDLNAKATSLVVSRIFMNEPAYRDRVLPNYGFGGAYNYGRAGYYGPGIDPATRHGGGRANLSDGKAYTAKDHYAAWLAYMKEYFRGRAERGFFLEYASNSYTYHTLNFVDLAYQYSGDVELKALIDNFLTLFWAEWAQVSISGSRGGPKTRHHKGVEEGGGVAALVKFKVGGTASAGIWNYWNVINDHRLPPLVWKMILDREGMGHYTYRARGIGEEENVLPRPLGTERSLVVDTDARFLKSTYVTPDYTLGTQMDHPSAVHSHLSMAGRWHGMTFAQEHSCRIVPVGLSYAGNSKTSARYNMEAMWQTAHHEQTLIVQQARRWFGIHPEWYPANIRADQTVGIWMGDAWERKVERDGWIFVQSGEAYAAVRPVLWDEALEREKWKPSPKYYEDPTDKTTVRLRADAYRWDESGTIVLLEEKHMPVVIEAGHQDDYPDLEAFIADVLDNPLALHKCVVQGDFILVYTGSSGKEMTFGTAAPQIPTIGGEPVNYSHPMTFDSPYLKSAYKSGLINLRLAEETLELDFRE